MYNIVPFLLIIASLAIIVVIIIRKFPQLTLLDVDSLPEVKEGKQKKEFIKKRSQKKAAQTKKNHQQNAKKVLKGFSKVQKGFRSYVTDVYNKVESRADQSRSQSVLVPKETIEEKTPSVSQEEKEKVDAVLQKAKQAYEQDKLDIAENTYISAIRLDQKNKEAYKGLVDVYLKQDQLKEAKETCQFLLQIHPDDDAAHIRMAEIADEMGDRHIAISALKKAIEINDALAERHFMLSTHLRAEGSEKQALASAIRTVDREPDNPRYLDNMLELAIMVGDKELSQRSYDQLRLVNPQNSKLESFKQKISAL